MFKRLVAVAFACYLVHIGLTPETQEFYILIAFLMTFSVAWKLED